MAVKCARTYAVLGRCIRLRRHPDTGCGCLEAFYCSSSFPTHPFAVPASPALDPFGGLGTTREVFGPVPHVRPRLG